MQARKINVKSLSDFVTMAVDSINADSAASLPMRITVEKAMIAVGGSSAAKEASALVLDSKLNVTCVTVETCQEAAAFMESLGGGNKERLMILIMVKFPFSGCIRNYVLRSNRYSFYCVSDHLLPDAMFVVPSYLYPTTTLRWE